MSARATRRPALGLLLAIVAAAPACSLSLSVGSGSASDAAEPAETAQDADNEWVSDEAAGPRIYRLIVPVTDLDAAAAWYEDLLSLQGERISGGRHYITCGGVVLALYQPSGDGDAQAARPLPDHLYFAVPDLEAVFARAARLGGLSTEIGDGGQPLGEIHTRPWGERSFYTQDPYGTRLCFVDDTTLFLGF